MAPSSRTPEGEPLRCPICGAACNVDVSRPPGDSVCPCCGAHVWVAGDRKHHTSAEIQDHVEWLRCLCEKNGRVGLVGMQLVWILTRCLSAYGAMLWISKRAHWWSRRTIVNLAASDGQTNSPEFAHEVVSANKSILRDVEIDGRKTLMIGMPVKRDDTVVGVIEVLKHSDVGSCTQEGCVQFVSQIAEILGGCESLSS